jgi:hypothetical protein
LLNILSVSLYKREEEDWMERIQNQHEDRGRKRGKGTMKKEREHPLVITIVLWLGYGGMKDLFTLLLPYFVDEPVKSSSILLNVILLTLLFMKKKKTRRQTSLK